MRMLLQDDLIDNAQQEVGLNCWDYKQCGHAPGAQRVDTIRLCPAALETAFDGVNGGHNAGRVCWAVAGTLCDGIEQGTMATKYLACRKCSFYICVKEELGESDFVFSPHQYLSNQGSTVREEDRFPVEVFVVEHKNHGTREEALVIALSIRTFVESCEQQGSHPVILHDVCQLQSAGAEYREVFSTLDKDLGRKIHHSFAVFPNPLMRLLARTINQVSGVNWVYCKSVAEAHKQIRSLHRS